MATTTNRYNHCQKATTTHFHLEESERDESWGVNEGEVKESTWSCLVSVSGLVLALLLYLLYF